MIAMSFGRPELWPWLLLALPIWFGLWYGFMSLGRGRQVYGALLTERVSSPVARATRLVSALVLVFVAVMEPRHGEETIKVERRGLDIIFALDTSRSMLARDMIPDRLTAAKTDIESVLPDLKGGDRVGLIAFAGTARLMVPLTHDLDSFRQLLGSVDTHTVRKGGTDLAAAIRKALDLVGDEDESTTVIVLLTDGEDLTGAARQAMREAKKQNVVVHAAGYGSTKGSKIILDENGKEKILADDDGGEVLSSMRSDSLRQLTAMSGGVFLRAEVMRFPLQELKRKRLDPMVKRAFDAGEETVYKTRFQWLLIPVILLLLLELLFVGGSKK